MSEPITLYRDGDEVTVASPSFAKDLQAEGWSLVDDYVPFSFHDEFDAVVLNPPSEAPVLESPKPAKRGRPRKAKA